eukprot:TRINITY_DN32574_c0_g1_i1.p1 TRINITY_DN32574_c0_g1~~TRINITY_DN32574_c0_g1_i1.p1  ORF type:complete len:622 (-),score=103.77 TRINITY_DN32574_c0_g1_i1:72-1937(-)
MLLSRGAAVDDVWKACGIDVGDHVDASMDSAEEDVIISLERWRRAEEGEHHGLRYKLKTKLFARHSQWQRLTDAIRAGVPPSLRAKVWFMSSGALTMKRHSQRPYSEWLQAGQLARESEAGKVIAADLPRTGCDEALLPALENILLAYSVRNPAVGYTQSMNFIAATFLQYCGEEHAFWMMCSLIEDLMPEGYYVDGLGGVRADLKVFDSIVQRYLPKLHLHFAKKDIDLTPILINWFLCLFVNTLPRDHAHRLMDIVLHEGSKVLFRAGLVILHLRHGDLLSSASVVEAYSVLREPFSVEDACQETSADSRALRSTQVSPEDFISRLHAPWLRGLRLEQVRKTRDECVTSVQADDARRAAQREAMRKRMAAEEERRKVQQQQEQFQQQHDHHQGHQQDEERISEVDEHATPKTDKQPSDIGHPGKIQAYAGASSAQDAQAGQCSEAVPSSHVVVHCGTGASCKPQMMMDALGEQSRTATTQHVAPQRLSAFLRGPTAAFSPPQAPARCQPTAAHAYPSQFATKSLTKFGQGVTAPLTPGPSIRIYTQTPSACPTLLQPQVRVGAPSETAATFFRSSWPSSQVTTCQPKIQSAHDTACPFPAPHACMSTVSVPAFQRRFTT